MPEHVPPPSPAADAPSGPPRMARDPSAARAARWRNEEALPHGTAHALGAMAAMLPALRLLVGLLIAALVIAALYFGRDILIPLALAVLLGFLLDPAVSRIKRWGLPRMAATLLVVDSPHAREQEVESGRADVFMTNFPYTRRMLDNVDWARRIAPPSTYHLMRYAYAVRPGDDRWLARVERFVSDIKRDGRLMEAARRNGLEPIVTLE